jgi:hypothetical protein
VLRKVLLLNTVNLPSSQQFQELSEVEKMQDPLMTDILKMLNNLHKDEMTDYKLQCVSRGLLDNNAAEYHVTWTSHGRQFRSYVRSLSGSLQETSFGEIQTISLDHYRLDEFEKLFILNYQKLNDAELKSDSNFQVAYQTLKASNSTLSAVSLIGVAQKPLGLGYVYQIFQRLANGIIIRSEVFLELFSLKITIKSIN